jgi:glycosyltransferase involved in cell wall biosynthesis
MLKAFPDAPLYTSLYDAAGTFPEFRRADIRPLALDRISAFRRHHRLALPLLASAFSTLKIEADVVLCSSSGWAHGVRTNGRKVVYCHAPARWLYQPDRYLRHGAIPERAVLSVLAPALRRWDARAAHSAGRYLTQSRAVREQIRAIYGIDAHIVPAPYRLDPAHEHSAVPGVDIGFFLTVSRLMPYKNLDIALDAFSRRPTERLVIVGRGPENLRLRRMAPDNVSFLGSVSDAELSWLYANCVGILAPSYEDYGVTVLEAAAFGKPVAALRFGGYLDTIIEGETGVLFDYADPQLIAAAIDRLKDRFNPETIRAHAQDFCEERFVSRLRSAVIN